MKLKLFNQLLEEIETYLEKDNKNGPIGGANQQHTDIGSITGNKLKLYEGKFKEGKYHGFGKKYEDN